MYGCMCAFEVTIRLKYKCLSNTLKIHNHGCKCCSEINIVSVKDSMTATNFFETKKHCTLEEIVKHYTLKTIKHNKLQGKNVFRNDYFGS